MSMEKTIIYLKAEQSSYVDHETIHIGDIASVYCGDKKKEEKIRNIILYEFDENKEKEGRIFLSILLVIEKISEQIPCGEVRNVGELDMVVYYKSKNAENKKWVQTAKILFIGATCFFGTGIRKKMLCWILDCTWKIKPITMWIWQKCLGSCTEHLWGRNQMVLLLWNCFIP